jgi:hypothetical protein
MDNALKGLFGSGGEDEVVATDRAKDFVRRYSEGPKDQGYEASEAADQLNRLLPKASADQVQRATRQALQDLPEDQRSQFGDFVKQVRQRDPGSREMADGGGFGMDDIAGMFGQAGGSANSIDDLFGGVLGGGGSGGGLGNILGGLLGGGADTNTRATQQDDGGGIGDFLGSGVGKVVLGGIAAYLTKEMLDDR